MKWDTDFNVGDVVRIGANIFDKKDISCGRCLYAVYFPYAYTLASTSAAGAHPYTLLIESKNNSCCVGDVLDVIGTVISITNSLDRDTMDIHTRVRILIRIDEYDHTELRFEAEDYRKYIDSFAEFSADTSNIERSNE